MRSQSSPASGTLIRHLLGVAEPDRRKRCHDGLHGRVMRPVLKLYMHGGLAEAAVDLDDISASQAADDLMQPLTQCEHLARCQSEAQADPTVSIVGSVPVGYC